MKAKSFLLGSKAYGLAVQRVWHHNWSEGRDVWPGAVLEASRGYCLFRHRSGIAAGQSNSSFVLCFFSFQTLWVNVVFKSAIEGSGFAFRLCFQLYSVELCFFYAFKKNCLDRLKLMS